MHNRFFPIIAIVVCVVLFFAINMLVSAGLRNVRLDLTSDRLYTLPAGARSIASSIDEPIRARFYFTRDLASGDPSLTMYARRVQDTLAEFASASRGKLQLEIIEPDPFSDEEDDAAALGLIGQPVGTRRLFFGLVLTNSTDGREVIAFFDPRQERFLNYEIAQRIHLLSSQARTRVGIVSSLPIAGVEPSQFQPRQQMQQPWVIHQELSRQYDVVMIDESNIAEMGSIDVLVVIHPQSLTTPVWYAIDQYILRNGRAVFAIDPHCETYVPPTAPNDQLQAYTADRSSSLGRLGRAWGVDLAPGIVAGDAQYAISVAAPGTTGVPIGYLPYMRLSNAARSDEDVVTAGLSMLTYQAGGVIERQADSSLTVTPLIVSSTDSQRISVERVKFPSPQELMRDFVPSGESLVLAARVTGPVRSAFAEGRPAGMAAAPTGAEHLSASKADINVIIFADADMFFDAAWVQPMRFANNVIYQRFADNGALMLNAVENLAGSSDLISIRASSTAFRPFKRVEELQKTAQTEYLAEEEKYSEELRLTEARINELLRASGDDQSAILSDEVRAEIQRLQERRSETRRNLRRVQHDLTKDVNKLGTTLKLINIALLPAMVALLALGLGSYRASRRTRDRRKMRESEGTT